MAQRMSNKQFIERSSIAHHGKYDYSSSSYVNKYTPVQIICPIHGLFSQSAHTHYNGGGCSKCGQNKSSESRRLSADVFIKRAVKTHLGKYSYTKSKYVSAHSKVEITCPTHGPFMQSPVAHVRGNGCPECQRVTTDVFISKSKLVHGERYGYDNSTYKGTHCKITINCHVHGEFNISPNEHYRGSGCKYCNNYGYDDMKPGQLYSLRSTCLSMVKIGITNDIHRRFKELRRCTPFNFDVTDVLHFQDGRHAMVLENEFHVFFEKADTDKFEGHTEWLKYSPQIKDWMLMFSRF